ncbi:MAG: hypothetical protein MUC81_00045 [Bacteroidia bacterium]|jgi:hypothetical protein|nr:hypothetical protein [Bacteroidia bacterium]
MQHFIIRNWLLLAITSGLVALYLTVFEGFFQGKAYSFLLLGLVFGAIYYLKIKKK